MTSQQRLLKARESLAEKGLEPLLTTAELAAYLKTCEKTILRRVEANKIPVAIWIGNQPRFKYSSIRVMEHKFREKGASL